MRKPGKGLALAAAALALGSMAGAMTAGFLRGVDLAQRMLWEAAPWADVALAPLALCTLGGLLVGLCQRFLGDHPQNIQEGMAELRATGRLDYRSLPQGVLTVGLSLIFGASLGPEAAIMDLLGGISTWNADRLRALRDSLGFPQPEGGSRRQRVVRQWANGLGLAAAFFVFGALAKGLYSGGFLTLQEGFAWHDLLWSVPLGVLGALVGALFLRLLRLFRSWLTLLRARPVLRSTLGGVALGAAASALPMILFSGQHDLQAAYQQAATLGAGLLVLIALTRLVLIALLLNSGWKGGQFLPLMFASTALGLAVSQWVPAVSAPAGVLGIMAGLLAVVLPQPVFSLALMALLFPLQYVGISAVAVLSVMAGKALFVRWVAQRAAQNPAQASQG